MKGKSGEDSGYCNNNKNFQNPGPKILFDKIKIRMTFCLRSEALSNECTIIILNN